MKTIFIMIAATFLVSTGAFAQDAPPPDSGPKVLMYQTNTAGPVGPVTASGGMFFSAEVGPGGGKAITGAPYMATASTETTQVLSDGNRIVNNSTSSWARDSQGRTRREETMGMVGPWQVNGPKLVFINDPASQTNYVLDENKQTAMVMKLPSSPAGSLPPPPLPPPGVQMRTGVDMGYMADGGGNVTFISKGPGGVQPDVKTESLGAQTMEGVSVEGKRVTTTIPAGQIGNLQPIETVSEVWFSPELQTVVMSKHSDPRFGETTYQLRGIQRSEPDPSLFQVPPGYTVQNMPAPMSIHAGVIPGGPGQSVVVGPDSPAGK